MLWYDVLIFLGCYYLLWHFCKMITFFLKLFIYHDETRPSASIDADPTRPLKMITKDSSNCELWDAMIFCNTSTTPKRRFWKAECTFRVHFRCTVVWNLVELSWATLSSFWCNVVIVQKGVACRLGSFIIKAASSKKILFRKLYNRWDNQALQIASKWW